MYAQMEYPAIVKHRFDMVVTVLSFLLITQPLVHHVRIHLLFLKIYISICIISERNNLN